MAEQKTYECNRCETIFYGPADYETPATTLRVLWKGSPKDEPEIVTLCANCDESYSEFMRAWKQFDKLALQTIKQAPTK